MKNRESFEAWWLGDNKIGATVPNEGYVEGSWIIWQAATLALSERIIAIIEAYQVPEPSTDALREIREAISNLT